MLWENDAKNLPGDFPGGPVIKNLPSKAGDMGLIPGQRTKIPQATTREACRPQQRPSTAEKKKKKKKYLLDVGWLQTFSVKCAISVWCDKGSYACVDSILTQVLDSLLRSAWALSGAPLSGGGYKVHYGDPPPSASTQPPSAKGSCST